MCTEELQQAVKEILMRGGQGQRCFKNYKPEQSAKLSKEDIDIIDEYIESVEKPSEQFIEVVNEVQTWNILGLDNVKEYVNEGKKDMLMAYMDFIGSYVECASKILEKVAVFIAATVVGALVGYGIGKFCEKVSEEKQNNPDMSMCTAIKNVLTPECLTSQSQVHP